MIAQSQSTRHDASGALPAGHETMSSAMADAENYHRWILDALARYVDGGTLLEIGPGFGQYTRALAGRFDRLVAVDVSQDCVDAVADVAPHVRGCLGDLSSPEFAAGVGEAAFDAAICLNVLEHVEDDVAALAHLREALRPGGRVVLLLPAHPALYGPMDRHAGHFRRYTRESATRALEAAGLIAAELAYFNPVGGLGWWLNARLLRPKTLSDDAVNRQILLFDRWILPISRLLDPLFRPLFGQSLWAVGERPA